MRLGRTFFSLYLLIVFSLLSIIWFLDQAWHIYLEQDVDSYNGYKVVMMAVEDRLLESPQEEWQDKVKVLADKYQISLSIRPCLLYTSPSPRDS